MNLTRDSNKQITKNFNEKEFFCKCMDAPESHYFDESLINVLQRVRDYYVDKGKDISIIITSTYRTDIGNVIAGGVANSPHKKGIAVDFVFSGSHGRDVLQDFSEQMLGKKYLFGKIREWGGNGIGIYDTFIHLDTRNSVIFPFFNSKDFYGNYSLWDKKKSKDEGVGVGEGSLVDNLIQGSEKWSEREILAVCVIGLCLLLLGLSRVLRR